MINIIKGFVVTLLVIFVSGCGGGSSSSTPPADYVGTVTITDANSTPVTFTFNNLGEIVSSKTSADTNGQYVNLSFSYDSTKTLLSGSPVVREVASNSIVSSVAWRVEIEYDTEHRALKSSLIDTDTNTTNGQFSYTYNQFNQIVQVDLNATNQNDRYTFTYENNSSNANVVQSTFDTNLDGINEIYKYYYTADGYLSKYTDDNDANGTANQAWRYIYDANKRLIREENDYNNDGGADSNRTFVYGDHNLTVYNDNILEITETYSDDTAKQFMDKILSVTDHQLNKSPEFLKLLLLFSLGAV